jgi:hypothetical protein
MFPQPHDWDHAHRMLSKLFVGRDWARCGLVDDDLYAAPKTNMTLNRRCRRFGILIAPCSIHFSLCLHDDAVITCLAFPVANADRCRRSEILPMDGIRREVRIPVDCLRRCRLRYGFSVKDSPGHRRSLTEPGVRQRRNGASNPLTCLSR